MEYQIIVGFGYSVDSAASNLKEKVDVGLKNGWHLCGGPTVLSISNVEIYLIQAMTRW